MEHHRERVVVGMRSSLASSTLPGVLWGRWALKPRLPSWGHRAPAVRPALQMVHVERADRGLRALAVEGDGEGRRGDLEHAEPGARVAGGAVDLHELAARAHAGAARRERGPHLAVCSERPGRGTPLDSFLLAGFRPPKYGRPWLISQCSQCGLESHRFRLHGSFGGAARGAPGNLDDARGAALDVHAEGLLVHDLGTHGARVSDPMEVRSTSRTLQNKKIYLVKHH